MENFNIKSKFVLEKFQFDQKFIIPPVKATAGTVQHSNTTIADGGGQNITAVISEAQGFFLEYAADPALVLGVDHSWR